MFSLNGLWAPSAFNSPLFFSFSFFRLWPKHPWNVSRIISQRFTTAIENSYANMMMSGLSSRTFVFTFCSPPSINFNLKFFSFLLRASFVCVAINSNEHFCVSSSRGRAECRKPFRCLYREAKNQGDKPSRMSIERSWACKWSAVITLSLSLKQKESRADS